MDGHSAVVKCCIGIIAVVALRVVLSFVLISIHYDASPYTSTYDTIVKTVAHIDYTEDAKLIYKDDEHDIAYYTTSEDSMRLSAGDTVYTINGDAVTVRCTDTYGFSVDYSTAFYPGMSGSAIVDSRGITMGYVSCVVNSEYVYCIWS